MNTPVMEGKITSSKTANMKASELQSSKTGRANQVAGTVTRQQSYTVMEVGHDHSETSGGGRSVLSAKKDSAGLLKDLNGSAGDLKVSPRLDSNASRRSTRGGGGGRGGGGAAVGGGEGMEEGMRYEDYFNNSDDGEEFGKKSKSIFKRFFKKMGCGTSQVSSLENSMPIVVFGATGTVGGAVARALLRDHRFSVRAVTRTPTTDQARALAEEGAVVVPGDLNDTRSLLRVMEGAAGVFLHINYWENLSKQKEITQGMNVIDAAVACNIHHLIYSGSEPTRRDEKPCRYMDAKAAVEEYLKETSLPFTVVNLPFLYENLISLFKPHMIRPNLYTLPIPMEEKPLDIMALQDVARCIVNIFLRPRNHMLRSVSLTGERMTVQHMADVLNKLFEDKKICYHRMSPSDFATFSFPGSEDLAAMFQFLLTAPPRDPRITRRIHASSIILDKWAHEHKHELTEALKPVTDSSKA